VSIVLKCDHKDCDREEEVDRIIKIYPLASKRMKQYVWFHPRLFNTTENPSQWVEVGGRIFCIEHGYEVDHQMTLASIDKEQSILAAALKETP